MVLVAHESRDVYLAESNNMMVPFWTVMESIVVLLVAVCQVYFVRLLFMDDTRTISIRWCVNWIYLLAYSLLTEQEIRELRDINYRGRFRVNCSVVHEDRKFTLSFSILCVSMCTILPMEVVLFCKSCWDSELTQSMTKLLEGSSMPYM